MTPHSRLRVAMLTVHSCPLGKPGTRDTGGMSVYVQNVARELGARDIAVDVFTHQHQHQPASPGLMDMAENVRLIHIPLGHGGDKLGLFSYLPMFVAAVEGFRRQEAITYSIVHSHYWLSGWVGMRLSEQWRVPHVAMLHTSARAKNRHVRSDLEPELRADTEQQVLAAASLVVTATEGERAELAELYGIAPGKIAVIPLGVDLDAFRPLPKPCARRAVDLDGLPVVLYVGRLGPGKGVEQLLEAAALVSRERAIQVVVVGGGDDADFQKTELHRLSERLGIGATTRFHSAVDQDELPLYYSSADVLVMPSHYETFGLVALEAMACGLPVIASPVGAMPRLVGDGEGGLLLDEASPSRLAAALTRFMGDDDLRQRLAATTRQAVAGLSWSKAAERLAEEYERLGAGIGRRAG